MLICRCRPVVLGCCSGSGLCRRAASVAPPEGRSVTVAPAPRPAPVRPVARGACAGGSQLVGHAGRRLQRRKRHVQCHGGTGRIFAICALFRRLPVGKPHSANAETPYSFKGNPWSYTAGAFLGYNVQLGSYVLGAEGDIAWKNGASSSTQYTVTPATYFGGPTLYRAESSTAPSSRPGIFPIRARAGFLYSPWTLIYATGGVAFGEVSGSFGYAATITYPGYGTTGTSGGASWSDSSCRLDRWRRHRNRDRAAGEGALRVSLYGFG